MFLAKFNPTITACLTPYIREEDNSVTSKKSDDFWIQCAFLLGVQCLELKRSNPNSQAVKKECGPEKGYGEKRCEIQGGGQEMAVMVG